MLGTITSILAYEKSCALAKIAANGVAKYTAKYVLPLVMALVVAVKLND